MTTVTPETADTPPVTAEPRAMRDLIADTVRDASELARNEAEFVKAELAEGARCAAIGAGMLAAAAVAGLLTIGLLAAAATLGLATTMPAWLAALIVAAVCAVAGGILALVGARSFRAASDEITTTMTQRLREDVQWLTHRLKPE